DSSVPSPAIRGAAPRASVETAHRHLLRLPDPSPAMTKRSYFVAGNWKMNLVQDEARALVRGIAHAMGDFAAIRVGIAPTFTSIAAAGELIGESGILLGAQNCHEKASGAYTGEISAPMLRD